MKFELQALVWALPILAAIPLESKQQQPLRHRTLPGLLGSETQALSVLGKAVFRLFFSSCAPFLSPRPFPLSPNRCNYLFLMS